MQPLEQIREFWNPQRRKCYYWERRLLLESLQKLCRHAQKGELLDVGCGRKPYHALFADRVSNYWGVDYPVTMLNSYKSATHADAFANCLQLPFQDNSFNTVLSTQVLEHVPDPRMLIAEMSRVLRPGGVLILSAPMTWPLHEEPYDFYRYTTHGLKNLLHTNRLHVIEEIQRGGTMLTLAQVLIDAEVGGHKTGGALWKACSNLLCLTLNTLVPCIEKFHFNRRLCLGISLAALKENNPKPRP